MGIYINPSARSFEMALNSEIFIDKSGLIKETNRCINTLQRYMCVSRPRRFGKSMAMDMLSAYYERNINTENPFGNLEISQDQSYKKDNNALADKIRKEELLLSIALSEYKQVIFDILTPIVEGAKITLTPIKGNVKDK